MGFFLQRDAQRLDEAMAEDVIARWLNERCAERVEWTRATVTVAAVFRVASGPVPARDNPCGAPYRPRMRPLGNLASAAPLLREPCKEGCRSRPFAGSSGTRVANHDAVCAPQAGGLDAMRRHPVNRWTGGGAGMAERRRPIRSAERTRRRLMRPKLPPSSGR